MSAMTRRVVPPVLFALFVVGWILVFTGGDGAPRLEAFTTAEGLETEIPRGWVVTDRPFEFVPAGSGAGTIDRWIVARACGDTGCSPAPAAVWAETIRQSPTFVQARADAGTLLRDFEETVEDGVRVVRAVTGSGAAQVFAAAAIDGGSFYVECGATIFDEDRGLADALVDVCRTTAAGN